jgi:hypothetical protein
VGAAFAGGAVLSEDDDEGSAVVEDEDDSVGGGEEVDVVDAVGEGDSLALGESDVEVGAGVSVDDGESVAEADVEALALDVEVELGALDVVTLPWPGAWLVLVADVDEALGELVVPVLEDEDEGAAVVPVEVDERGAGPARCVSGGGTGFASASSSGCGGAVGGRPVTASVLLVALAPSPTVMKAWCRPCPT